MAALAGIIILGIFAQWIAWRTKVPAILPLIIIGLIVGPLSTLYTIDGCKLIQPMSEGGGCSYLFPGEILFHFVSLAIGIILFEGGLTLRRKEIGNVGPAIVRLITVGPLITFIGGGLAAHYIMDLSWAISFLFAALIIVTGPTVIAPILQNVPLNRNVATVLKWEGILIDPVGALVAVLVFEFINAGEYDIGFTTHAFRSFFQILFIGLSAGALGAGILFYMIKRELIPHYLLNVFTLGLVLGVYTISDVLAHESGLLAVVVMGMVLGELDVPQLKEILTFKEALSILLISILFILLSANIDIADLRLLQDWNVAALFGVIILILRPLVVFFSIRGEDLTVKEKLFISWVGPRGIVAAGIASLFGLKLMAAGVEGARYITPLVFMVVLGTVILNATTARIVARMLGVIQEQSKGILIVGANHAARLIARYLQANDRHVVLVDSNNSSIKRAEEEGLDAYQINVYQDDLSDKLDLIDAGYLLALTGSSDVNRYALQKFRKQFGENGAFRLINPEEMKMPKEQLPPESLFSPMDDYINIMEVIRDYPEIFEIPIASKSQFLQLIEKVNAAKYTIPLFIKRVGGELDILPAIHEDLTIAEGDALVCIGKQLEEELAEAPSP